MAQQQIRVVLSDRAKPIADELLEVTGVENYSQLIALMFTRYGHHMKNSWMLPTCALATSEASALPLQPTPEAFSPIDF